MSERVFLCPLHLPFFLFEMYWPLCLSTSPQDASSLPDTFGVSRRKAHGSDVVASDLAPTRAPHIHPTAPCHYMSKDHPTPDDGAAGHTGGVRGRRTCSGTGRGRGWMGHVLDKSALYCGCQVEGERKCVRERGLTSRLVKRLASRTGTRPPHPLHPSPCPYRTVFYPHLTM
jgi:hypothetical protein